MKYFIFLILSLLSLTCHGKIIVDKKVDLIKSMFSNTSEKLDASNLDKYYNQDFILVSNDKSYNYSVYKKQQEDVFKQLSSIKVTKYEDIFSAGNKVTGMVKIKLTKKDGVIYDFSVIFIALIKNNKISRIWEITYPTWEEKVAPATTSNQ